MRRALPSAGFRLAVAVLAAGAAASASATAFPPEVWHSPCGDGPEATCVSPAASDAARVEASAEPPLCGVAASDVRAALEGWAAASRTHLPIPEAEKLRLRFSFPGRSGQEIALAAELQGPVDADELRGRYDWSLDRTGNAVCLTAVPKDKLERLFYGRFTVTLDAATLRPVAICFAGPDGTAGESLALRPWIDEEAGGAVRLAGFAAERTAAKPIRTADLSGDAELTDAAFVAPVPPAPLAPLPCRTTDAPLRPIPEPVEAPVPPGDDGEPAALRDVLEKFDRNYAAAGSVRLELRSWKFDLTFQVETRSRIEGFVRDDGCSVWEVLPVDAAEETVRPAEGFDLKRDAPVAYRWSPDRVVVYDLTSGRGSEVARPASNDGGAGRLSRSDGWFACSFRPEALFPVWTAESANDLRKDCRLRLAKTTDVRIYVTATPRFGETSAAWSKLDVIFDRETGHPIATQTTDPSGNKRVVLAASHIFRDPPKPVLIAVKPY